MNLSPEDVEQVRFRVALRGYAEDEVDLFLDRVVDTIRNLEAELARARWELKQANTAQTTLEEGAGDTDLPPDPPPQQEESVGD